MSQFDSNVVVRSYRMRALVICLAALVCLGSSLNSLDTLRIVQDLNSSSLEKFKVETEPGEARYLLPKGRYYLTEPLRLDSNTVLLGNGPETELAASPQFEGEQFITNAQPVSGNSNIKLQGFKVIFAIERLPGDLPGVLRFENVEQLTISDVDIDANTFYYAIDLSKNIVDAVVTDCNIQNLGSGGAIQVRNRGSIDSPATQNIRISKNTLSSVNDEPVAVFGWMGRVADVGIENNTIAANGASFGITAYGIDKVGQTGQLEKVTISGNTITGSRHGAIAVKGGAKNIVAEYNRINHAHNDGIFVDNGGSGLPAVFEVTIRGNIIDETGRHGIYAAGFNIHLEDNEILRSKEAGIFVSAHGGGRVDILNNTIETVGRNIILSGPTVGAITGNQMTPLDDILRIE